MSTVGASKQSDDDGRPPSMRLNLGCGDRYVPAWQNIDLPSCPHRVDQHVDLTGPLPWPPGTVEAVYAGHVLEHLSRYQCQRLLGRLLPLMTPGGQIMIVGPDFAVAEAMAARGESLEVPLGHIRDGIGRWAGDLHLWQPNAERVCQLLAEVGWADPLPVPWDQVGAVWPVAERGPRWQFAATAEAPQ